MTIVELLHQRYTTGDKDDWFLTFDDNGERVTILINNSTAPKLIRAWQRVIKTEWTTTYYFTEQKP